MGCGATRPKRELIRFVFGSSGLEPDPEGRRPGRGAYLCREGRCGRTAIERGGFARALKAQVRITRETLDFIENGQEASS